MRLYQIFLKIYHTFQLFLSQISVSFIYKVFHISNLHPFIFILLQFCRQKNLNSQVHYRRTRCTKYTHIAQFIVFRVSATRWIILIFVYVRTALAIVVASIDVDAEKIYIRLEIFRDIPLCRQNLRLPSRTCVRSLCHSTFINYCRRRGRMRSHKSTIALSLFPYQPCIRVGKCYIRFYIYTLPLLV